MLRGVRPGSGSRPNSRASRASVAHRLPHGSAITRQKRATRCAWRPACQPNHTVPTGLSARIRPWASHAGHDQRPPWAALCATAPWPMARATGSLTAPWGSMRSAGNAQALHPAALVGHEAALEPLA